MSDPRKDLMRQMMALRRTLDPKVLERAKLAVFGKVPFDRDNARAAVATFLDGRADGGAFRRKLEEALAREGGPPHDADGSLADAERAAAPPPKPRRIGRLT